MTHTFRPLLRVLQSANRRHVAIIVLLLLAAAIWFSGVWRTKPSVLLITMDATRADRLGLYGYQRAETPRLDALATEAVVFDEAYASAPLCAPSHATILTGQLPPHHGIRDDQGFTLIPSVTTLAESFKRAGYSTAAFVSSTTLDRSLGLDRGFDVYDDDLGPSGKRPLTTERAMASETIYRMRGWLDGLKRRRPFFVWIHLNDAEAPYAPPDPFRKKFAGNPYDGEIAYTDRELGNLLAHVREDHSSLVIAVIGDHGEALGDHDEETHGYFLYGATTRVPFLISLPRQRFKGQRIKSVVRTADLAPTLLDVTGVGVPAGMDGRSLLPAMSGNVMSELPAPIENVSLPLKYGLAPLFALRSGAYLYVRAPRPELYDVRQDPRQADDAAARLPQIATTLDRQLRELMADARTDLSDQLEPKDNLALFLRYQAGLDLQARGECDRAAVIFQTVLSEAPGFVFARRKLSECLEHSGRFGETEWVLNDAMTRGEANEATYLNLAWLQHRLKHDDAALIWLNKGLERFPRSAALRHRAGRVLLQLKKPDNAARELREAVRLEPRFTDAWLALGEALQATGHREDARRAYNEVLDVGPSSSEAAEARRSLGTLGK